jgi:hypothetical protein
MIEFSYEIKVFIEHFLKNINFFQNFFRDTVLCNFFSTHKEFKMFLDVQIL